MSSCSIENIECSWIALTTSVACLDTLDCVDVLSHSRFEA